MKKPFDFDVLGRKIALSGALVLAVGCTGRIGPGPGNSTGNAAGSAGAGSPGSGGMSATGMGGSGSPGTGGTVSTSGTGGTTAPPDPNTIVVNPPAFTPAPGMLRRLTRTQFRNAMKDVFGYAVDTSTLDADSWDANFASIGAAVVVTSDHGAEQYNTAVENAVNTVFNDSTKRSQFIGCTPTGQSSDTCLRGYIQKLGLRAWRRPLTSAELDGFGTLAASASTTLGSAVEGARWATVELFESPNFIYRPELGTSAASGGLRFSGYEMAGRLSFLIWNSLPDQTLMDQATSGMLATADGIRTDRKSVV